MSQSNSCFRCTGVARALSHRRRPKSWPSLPRDVLVCFFIFFASLAFSFRAEGIEGSGQLTVTSTSMYTADLINKLVDRYHYRKPKLDDSLSSKVFDEYLSNLDPGRSYFLENDILQFERLRYRFDDLLETRNLEPAYAMFSMYKKRALNRVGYVQKALANGFDFSTREEYTISPDSRDWCKNIDESDELWRKRLKHEWLSLALAGEEPDVIRTTLLDRYKNMDRRLAQIKENDVFELLMNTYLSTIGPHTAFFSPRETENFKIRMSLSLEGIGAVLQTNGDNTLVYRVLPGGPAGIAGELQSGDRIVGVAQGSDGKMVDVVGWRLDDVVDLIRGPKGTIVRLKILPQTEPAGGLAHVLQIRRDTIRLEEQAARSAVTTVARLGQSLKIGIITIPTFYIDFDAKAAGDKNYRSTTRDVEQLLLELQSEQIDGIVIDLRGNGGGSLTEAVSMTGLFIRSGPVVQIRNSSGKIAIRKDSDPIITYSGPLMIVVDSESASASEIFAAALQDYNRGYIAGQRTFGKGTVQNLIDLDQWIKDESAPLGQLKITTAQFFRVNGEGTQYRGVIPDFSIPPTKYVKDHTESAHANALPWSAIRPTSYRQSNRTKLAPTIMTRIKEQHLQRINQNPSFNYFNSKITLEAEAAEQTVFSLYKPARILERQNQEEQTELLTLKFRQHMQINSSENIDLEELARETTMQEALNILGDIIQMTNQ
ncbi:MAG: tail-specific protease [Acidiferrobacteraceae bacterium]|nr:tail-specific protease [Acidiferrobacteraceae bacterium]